MKEPILEPLLRRLRFRKVLRHIQAHSVVVDVGCGHTPHFLNRLSTYIRKGVGIDQFIQNGHDKNIELVSVTLRNKLPVKSGLADYVTLIAVLEHLENPQAILSESYRILRPGGTIIITTPTHLNKPILEFLSFQLGIVSRREIAEHKRYFWRKELTAYLRKAGFRGTKHQYFELFCNNLIVGVKPD